jgi:thiol-disulfide isomerase/thioredoxin
MSKLLSRRAFSGLAAAAAVGAGWPMQGALAASPGLKDYGRAPEFAGIDKWLNSGPLTMQGLAGKVVLVDFWTYTCINCIRTLPHVVRWYETYKDQGFVVVGVHSPEFAYERSTRNVQDAIERFNIRYPVAQDNSFTTWKAYGNQYWPAFYLVDSRGQVMRQHFGEGEYAEMEAAIQALLAKRAGG